MSDDSLKHDHPSQVKFAEQDSRLDRIEVTLTHAVDAIEKMSQVLNRPQETKWAPILTAIGLLLMAAGGYTTLITLPMDRTADRLQQEIQEMGQRELGRERALGRLEGIMGVEDDG